MLTSTRPAGVGVATLRTGVPAAIALLLISEATLFFTFVFIIGPIATLERVLPLAVILVLSAALYWKQDWARWALLAPIAFRMRKLVLLTAAAWGVGRTGIALFLMFIILAELFAAFILVDSYLASRHRLNPGS